MATWLGCREAWKLGFFLLECACLPEYSASTLQINPVNLHDACKPTGLTVMRHGPKRDALVPIVPAVPYAAIEAPVRAALLETGLEGSSLCLEESPVRGAGQRRVGEKRREAWPVDFGLPLGAFMDTLLLTRVRQSNPWLFGGEPVGIKGPSSPPTGWIDRTQVNTRELLKPGLAHIVIGPRQAGKSSLIWSILRQMKAPLYINAEEPLFREWTTSPLAFLEDIGAIAPSLDALFIEEAQWLPSAGLFLKGLVDQRPEFPILVTGSSSFHLGDRIRESLAGRATRHNLFPFGLSEVSPPQSEAAPAVFELSRRDNLTKMLRLGSYPEAWKSRTPADVLTHLLQALILRDATDLLSVERPDAFVRILKLAAGQIGNIVNVSEYASLCGIAGNTVNKYLAIMQEMHVLYLVPPFSGGRRRELTSASKAYFVDNGFRNTLLNRLSVPPQESPDFGAVVENWVFSELLKTFRWPSPVRYWRSLSGAEVDFVLELPDRLVGIEVKAGVMNRKALSRSSRSFIDAYSPNEFWVLNDSLRTEDTVNTTTLRWLPLYQLPESLSALGRSAV